MFEPTSDTSQLPPPDEQALRQSERLLEHITAAITQAGEPFTLGEFIHEALYAPGLGYYAAGARKLGEEGDFVTAPELGSVFAQCVARGFIRIFSEIGHSDHNRAQVLELGAGSGQFAYDCLLALQALDQIPSRYMILEVSPDFRERQKALLSTLPEALSSRIEWLDAPPDEPFEGVIFANEVIDALPMERFGVTKNGDIVMEYIDVNEDGRDKLVSTSRSATPVIASAVESLRERCATTEPWSLPYEGEIRAGLAGWLKQITRSLEKGAVLFVDYGSDANELYRSDRSKGTLLCHYQHRAHDQVLLWPGLQDITAWVDFSQVAQAAHELGFELNGYTTQAHMLIDFDLDDVVGTRFVDAETATRLKLASEVKQLTMPGEMGERFKAISFTRGLDKGLLTSSHASLERRL